MKVKKGDNVKIMSGKDAGKTGNILKVYPETDKVTVEGLNLFKKKVRPTKTNQKGETVLVPRPLPASRVRLVCKNCKMVTRVGYKVGEASKERVCKKCDATI